jgi:hypothetical protein
LRLGGGKLARSHIDQHNLSGKLKQYFKSI